jgi:hypothetical protein
MKITTYILNFKISKIKIVQLQQLLLRHLSTQDKATEITDTDILSLSHTQK